MPATGRSRTALPACHRPQAAGISRRACLFAAAALALRADDESDVWDLLTSEASALSEGNAITFMAGFDRSMPGYQTLETNIKALLNDAQVQSSIELLTQEETNGTRMVKLDWFLQIVEQQDSLGLTRRREVVQCRLAKQKKKWRITSIEPLSFFAPLKGAAPR